MLVYLSCPLIGSLLFCFCFAMWKSRQPIREQQQNVGASQVTDLLPSLTFSPGGPMCHPDKGTKEMSLVQNDQEKGWIATGTKSSAGVTAVRSPPTFVSSFHIGTKWQCKECFPSNSFFCIATKLNFMWNHILHLKLNKTNLISSL